MADKNKEEKEQRTGLFGAPLRERNDRTVIMLYGLAIVYLLYTSYQMVRDLMNGTATGTMRTVYMIAPVVFVLASAWIGYMILLIRKKVKAEEEEQMKKDAEEAGETYIAPEDRGSLVDRAKAFYLIQPTEEELKARSVANRATRYVNIAEDDLETEGEAAAAEAAVSETSENEENV